MSHSQHLTAVQMSNNGIESRRQYSAVTWRIIVKYRCFTCYRWCISCIRRNFPDTDHHQLKLLNYCSCVPVTALAKCCQNLSIINLSRPGYLAECKLTLWRGSHNICSSLGSEISNCVPGQSLELLQPGVNFSFRPELSVGGWPKNRLGLPHREWMNEWKCNDLKCVQKPT